MEVILLLDFRQGSIKINLVLHKQDISLRQQQENKKI
jgi:hypothetical protein